MRHPLTFFALSMSMARLGADSQAVIAERMTRFARGDIAAGIEASRMMTEKTLALGEVQARLASAMMTGRMDTVGRDIVRLYGRKVRANRKRLRC